jgi:Helicase associated domain
MKISWLALGRLSAVDHGDRSFKKATQRATRIALCVLAFLLSTNWLCFYFLRTVVQTDLFNMSSKEDGLAKQAAPTKQVPAKQGTMTTPPAAAAAAAAADAATTDSVPPAAAAAKTKASRRLPLSSSSPPPGGGETLSPRIQTLRTTFQLLNDQEFEYEVEIERKRRARRQHDADALQKKQQKSSCPHNNKDVNVNNDNKSKKRKTPPPVEAADAVTMTTKDNGNDNSSNTANNNNLPSASTGSGNKKRKANAAAAAPVAYSVAFIPPYMYHYPYHPYHHPALNHHPMMGSYPTVPPYGTAAALTTAYPTSPPPHVPAAGVAAAAAASLPSPPKEQPNKEDGQQNPARKKRGPYRKKGKMTEVGGGGEPAAAKTTTDVVMTREQKWETRLLELQKFKTDHGHLNVSSLTSTSEEYLHLYRWICKQKLHWTKFLRGDYASSKLTPEKIQKLIDVGLGTSQGPTSNKKELDDRAWEENFANLVKYKNEHGHTDLTKRKQQDDEIQKLASWVETQRSNFNRRQHRAATGVKKRGACMTDAQLERLCSIGFRFTNKTSTFEE